MKRLHGLGPLTRPVVTAGMIACMFSAGAWAQDAGGPTTKPAGNQGTTISVTRPGTFEIHVQGADLRGVLQLLSTQGKRNIVATKEVKGTVTADLYGVTFEQALKAVLASSGLDYIEEDDFIYVYTAQQKAAILEAKEKPVVKVFHLSYITATDAQLLVTPLLSQSGSMSATPAAAVGIEASKSDTGGNAHAAQDVLIVKDAPSVVKRIEEVIAELDVRPDQVLIETTILRADLGEDNQLGVNFNALNGVEFQDLGFTADAAGNDINFQPNQLTENNVTAVNFRTDFSPVQGGMTFGIFGSDIAFFVTALEGITDVTVVANPKLLVMNKQRGEVMVGSRDGYLTTTVTETTATQTVEFLETGTLLIVRPFIAKDRHIRMEIHPEDSDGRVTLNLPSEDTTEVTSNVLVRDGHTIIIGGLFRESTDIGKTQVPGVGNIPYLGSLFRTHNNRTEREEVIILITPHIIDQPRDEAVSEQLRDDIERFRVGQRKGLRWWAADRLANSNLRLARQAVRDGKQAEALWLADMALSIRPRMMEAVRLREQLTQKAYWSDSVRHSSVHYAVQRMLMHELGKPIEPVIPHMKPRNAEGISPDVRQKLGIEPRFEMPLEGTAPSRQGAVAPAGQGPKPAVTPAASAAESP